MSRLNYNRLSNCANRCLLAGLILLAALNTPFVVAAEYQWQNVNRIVAVGDIHGDYDNFLQVLRDAEVVNQRGNWIADDTHLVQLGDVPDRGPDTDKVIALLQKLERQAERAGGKVHALIGNHEAMNMYGDLRYVHPGEYEAMRTSNSKQVRDDYYELDIERRLAANPEFIADKAFREQWEQTIPLGMIEHQFAWSAQGDIGKWVLQHNAVIKINRTLFLHGGISPEIVGMEITAINDQIRQELNNGLGDDPGLSESESSPLWYRGLASNDEMTESAHLAQVLATYDVDRIVVGHTPGLGTVVPRFDSKVLVIDAGLSKYYGGHLASLSIEGNELSTVQRGVKIAIPDSADGLLQYFISVGDLEPAARALQKKISDLSAPSIDP